MKDSTAFTSWQTTGKNNNSGAAHTVTYDGLAPSHPLTAAGLATCRPCSRTKDVKPQPRLVPIYRPRRNERLGCTEHVRVSILPNDVIIGYFA